MWEEFEEHMCHGTEKKSGQPCRKILLLNPGNDTETKNPGNDFEELPSRLKEVG